MALDQTLAVKQRLALMLTLQLTSAGAGSTGSEGSQAGAALRRTANPYIAWAGTPTVKRRDYNLELLIMCSSNLPCPEPTLLR